MFQDIVNIKNVFTYHVNVGHGNTSFIVIETLDNNKTIIGVDCSITDNKERCKKNIDKCIHYIKNKFGLHEFKLQLFLLTHPHHDHYSGIDYLIDNKSIVNNTEIWLNNAFLMRSSFLYTIKQKLFLMGCRFVHPIKQTTVKRNLSMINIWYPEKIVVRKGSNYKTNTGISLQEETNANNASVIASFNFNIQDKTYSILFTGDIEKSAWDKVKCPKFLGGVKYYCISHHGSLNGHERNICPVGQKIKNISQCPNKISKAILMGRNNAYSGIYSHKVLTDFNGKIKKTESNKFIELDFLNDKVYKHR